NRPAMGEEDDEAASLPKSIRRARGTTVHRRFTRNLVCIPVLAPAFESGRDQPMIGAPGSVARGSGGFMTNRSGERPGGQRVDLCPLSQPAQRGTRGATSAQIDGLASGTTDDISAQVNWLVDWGGDRPPSHL